MKQLIPHYRKIHVTMLLLTGVILGLLFLTGCSSDSGDNKRYLGESTEDTDSDTISDYDEGFGTEDTDGDGIYDTEDLDSDNDGISDADEAGDADLSTAPIDTDGDGLADFRDTDSDNDGLPDYQETFYEYTDPYNDDSDDDGVTDLVEVETGTDPLEPADNPKERGDFAFLAYYGDSTDPAIETFSYLWDQMGTIDITAVTVDDGSDSVDAVAAFIGSVPAETALGAPCAAGLTVIDYSGDGTEDTFIDVSQDTNVCFDVIPCTNTTVERSETPQTFKATVLIYGDHVAVLDTHDLYFIVPPEVPGGGQ